MKMKYLALMVGVAMLAGNAWAESWDCSPDPDHPTCTATLDSNGTLTISGTGSMADYLNAWGSQVPEELHAPWDAQRRNIKSIVIEDGITSIGKYACYGCSSVKSITISNSVTSVGKAAFSGTGITSVDIPNSVTSIGEDVFRGATNLASINIPDSVSSIGFGSFHGTNLTQDALKDINPSLLLDGALAGMQKLTSFVIPEGTTSIGYYAFANTGITSITIPDSVTEIGNSAFRHNTNLTSITIPDSVTSIGQCAFCDITNMDSITIGKGVTNIDNYIFSGASIASIFIDGNPQIGDGAFQMKSFYDYQMGKWTANTKIYCMQGVDCENKGQPAGVSVFYYEKDENGYYKIGNISSHSLSGLAQIIEAKSRVESSRTNPAQYSASEASLAVTGSGNNQLSIYFK